MKRTYTFESISRYAALAMTPVTMTPNQPRVWRSVETADGGQRKIRKGRDISDISNITKNNDPLSQSAPFSLTSQPQIERELCGVTCSHDDCRVHPNSESRAWILLNSPINAGPVHGPHLVFFFFLKYPLIFFLRTVSNFHNIHQPTRRPVLISYGLAHPLHPRTRLRPCV